MNASNTPGMDRDESSALSSASVMDAVPWGQFQRYRRGVIWTPRAFSLQSLRIRSCDLEFVVTGETDTYSVLFSWGGSPMSTDPLVACNCPDEYAGLCKHVCWLIFKVLKHDDLGVFRTRTCPKDLLGTLFYDEPARETLVEMWGRGGSSFQGVPDRELSFAAWGPPCGRVERKCPFGPPNVWPPPHLECVICFDDMEQSGAKQCPNCLNSFHDACISKWFSSSKTSCPLCRKVYVVAPDGLF